MVSRLKIWMVGVSAIMLITFIAVSYNNYKAESSIYAHCNCSVSFEPSSNMQICKRDAHISWFAWLSGESSSAQFHYLDLLELLLGSQTPSSNRDVLTSSM
jgi:hypothetical protein